jgi:hypothetical protein
MKYKNIIQKYKNTHCFQISHQRYISAVIHTALLNNVRKVGKLVLSRTSCKNDAILYQGWTYPRRQVAMAPTILEAVIGIKMFFRNFENFGLTITTLSGVHFKNWSRNHSQSKRTIFQCNENILLVTYVRCTNISM